MAPQTRIVLPVVLVLCAMALSALHAQQPRLDVLDDHSSHELMIEEKVVSEIYPLLTFLFFDSASAEIPDRYIRFAEARQTAGFSDSTIPGGTLEKYHQLLNIIGYRMHWHPTATITITGVRAVQRTSGETRQVAIQRGEAVYDYLMQVWNIDPARMHLRPPRDLSTTNAGSPGLEENRRVEIISDDWEIMRPVVNTDVRRYPQPDVVRFRMENGMEGTRVARRTIEVRRGGSIWHVMEVPPGDSISPEFNWGRGGDPDVLPDDGVPYNVQLVVYDVDGVEHRSKNLQLPVKIVTIDTLIRHGFIDKIVRRFWISFFTSTQDTLGSVNERILRDFVCGILRPGTHVEAVGYADTGGAMKRDRDLAASRARKVNDVIGRCVPKQWNVMLTSRGAEEGSSIYPGDTPEGRCYNRAVVIIVTMPVGVGD